jgi:hypothetical protein
MQFFFVFYTFQDFYVHIHGWLKKKTKGQRVALEAPGCMVEICLPRFPCDTRIN